MTVLAVIVPLILLCAIRRYQKMQYENRKPFPFMQLPQELRDMVYEHLIEDPVYPPPQLRLNHGSSLWMIPGLWSSSAASSRRLHTSNWIFLANKQVYKECMDVLCKRATFHLTVSPHNYKPSSSSSPPPPSPPHSEDKRLWNISPDTLKDLRTASLNLITTSAMLGVPDPRNMTSTDWTLARHVREELKQLVNVKNLTLDAKALGDPLWNPLWIWYHACQSFKTMGTSASNTSPTGPKLNRITFSLDTWSPGENYLARHGDEDKWTWFCMQGHGVGLDIGPEMTVREFCGKLYQECRICRPELESEEE
ncbi:uncharacterized protein K460DRAFT_287877 [Cucurbitaria berberidis CBS 394.84]|uniref:Uncharacterized protein n=1 Tax=Cucurbitaria berberidis CBS 394.84 TaxID=1168544 RepID=A0A9P4GEK2_9PLEO|nr:uncharacterized protein K460DRAFT_287877 [Cucurbitaria berberidis CBS 394.84]KAF1844172.1 hypothetical protein K460DRAFT_287877 [Cucurbitaria berberidis CBS 394.84]